MATIKSFTDLYQSKKLAEILPLESADMGWNVFVDDTTRILPINDWNLVKDGSGNVKFYHAWSLAALLGVLPKYEINNFGDTIQLDVNLEALETEGNETLLDLVVNMIIHLHELKML